MSRAELRILNWVLLFLLGVYGALEWMEFTDSSNGRFPSSIEPVNDYSDLKGEKLISKARQRLEETIFIKKDGQRVALNIGNFVMPGAAGEKTFACGYFDQVEYVFSAHSGPGGAPAQLTIQAPCQLGRGINEMASVTFNFKALLKQEPGDFEYQEHFGPKAPRIKTQSMGSKWPTTWQLEEVTLTHSKFASRTLRVPTHTKNIVMAW
ncbi:MAG: hypothetical protein IT289_12585 [Oligoflexia bacterium]|nr:hypothetical protein [Oligoflexia bacterium]